MNFPKSNLLMTKFFAASALGLALTGCATTPGSEPGECMEETKSSFIILPFSKRTYNKECALGKWAEAWSKSSDIGEQLTAQNLKEQLGAKEAADGAREALQGYKAGTPRIDENGRKVIVLTPLVPKKPVEPAAPGTLVPAPTSP
ncbi:MAG: hypothetical protein JWO78_1559 [Micavibrio sp.]|nr:hypothetical protein [Micavibrio sp.]